MHDGFTAVDKPHTSETVNYGSEFPKDATRSDERSLLETPVIKQFRSESNYMKLPVSIATHLDFVVELNSSDSNSSKDIDKNNDRDGMEVASINQCTSENVTVKQNASDPFPFMNAATSSESDFHVNGISKQTHSNLGHSSSGESQSTDLNTCTEADSKKIVLEHQSVVQMSSSNSDLDIEDTTPVPDSLTELKACFDPEFYLNGNGIQSFKKMNSSDCESVMEPTASTEAEFVIDKYLM